MINLIYTISIIIFILSIITYSLLTIHKYFKTNDSDIVEKINSYLPQTQCGQCNYPGCKPYAIAISNNEVDINRCPPGGQETIDNLANLLNLPAKSLSKDLKPINNIPIVAKINESECIGCLLCIKACPVDAIIGANKLMHTVISSQCTGCELCVDPCPMSCITMIDNPIPIKYNYK